MADEPADTEWSKRMALLEWKNRYIGGDTPAEIFESLVGGSTPAYTVINALEVAKRRYEEHADEMRGLATAMGCDGQPVGLVTLAGAGQLAFTFDQQAEDVEKLIALLRGDDEPED